MTFGVTIIWLSWSMLDGNHGRDVIVWPAGGESFVFGSVGDRLINAAKSAIVATRHDHERWI